MNYQLSTELKELFATNEFTQSTLIVDDVVYQLEPIVPIIAKWTKVRFKDDTDAFWQYGWYLGVNIRGDKGVCVALGSDSSPTYWDIIEPYHWMSNTMRELAQACASKGGY